MAHKVLISMIGCGRREGTKHCLGRAMATVPRDVQFILTDNASKDGTGDMFEMAQKSLPDRITVFRETENTGFIPPGNRAYHLSVTRDREFTILLNDDTDPPEGWLQKLLAPFEDPTVALVCPQGTCCSLDSNFHGFQGPNFEYAEGSCLAIRNSAIQSFSKTLFDENLTGIYGDDSNLSLRVREKGWKIAQADFDMPHIRSATTRAPEVKAFCDFHQKKNHEYNVKRWAPYLRTRRMDFPIILRRSYAIGDVLLTTPIIRAIAQSNPLSQIHVQTNYPELFARNPYVASATMAQPDLQDALFIDLDGSYENQPMTHIVHAYERTTREKLPGLGPVDLRTEIFPAKEDMEWAEKTHKNMADDTPLVCFGMDATTWRGKNWPEERFYELRHRFHKEGWTTLAVGAKKPEVQTSFHQLASLLSKSKLFIGNDSFCLHAAQAAGCPVVAPFGPTRARFILTQGSKAAGVDASPSIPCAGERHRTVGKTFVDCDASCINSITVDQMWAAIEKLGVL